MKKTWISEIATVAAVLVAVIPAVMDLLPIGSEWVSILAVALSVCTYVAGHKYEKVAQAKIVAASEALKAGPTPPST